MEREGGGKRTKHKRERERERERASEREKGVFSSANISKQSKPFLYLAIMVIMTMVKMMKTRTGLLGALRVQEDQLRLRQGW